MDHPTTQKFVGCWQPRPIPTTRPKPIPSQLPFRRSSRDLESDQRLSGAPWVGFRPQKRHFFSNEMSSESQWDPGYLAVF